MRFFLSYIYILLFQVHIQASTITEETTPLIISSKTNIYNLNQVSRIFITRDTLSGNEAWTAIHKGKMEEIQPTINPGMNAKDQTFWLLFTIENQIENEEIYLEIDYPQLDYIQLLSLEGDSVSLIYKTGDRFPFDSRPVFYRNFILPMKIANGKSKSFLLNVDKRSSAIRFPIEVYSSEISLSRISKENIYYGFYFGFFLLIFLVSLLVGLFLKRALFIWYSFYVLFFSLWIFSRLGFSYQYIIPNYPALNTHFFPVITSTAITFLILYVMSFFETKVTIPHFHKLMQGVLSFIISFFFIWALIPDQFLKFAPLLFFIKYTLTFLVIVFAYTAAINFLKIDAFRAKIFIGAYSMLFLGIASVIFGEYGLGKFTFLIDPFMLGFMVEVIMLTFLMIRSVLKILSQKEELLEGNQHLALILKNTKKRKEASLFTLNSKAVINLSDLMYIKSDDHYLEFNFKNRDRPEVDRGKMNELLKRLPSQFVKVHRSYLVNTNFIKLIKSKQLVIKNGEELPISRTYKDSLKEITEIIK